MKQVTLLNDIKVAAAKLKKGKLKKLNEIQPSLERIAQTLGMQNTKEAMVFLVTFDRKCDNDTTEIRDFAEYFDCPMLEVVEYKKYFSSLVDLKLLLLKEDICIFENKFYYDIPDTLFDDIINEQPIRKLEENDKIFNQFDFISKFNQLTRLRREDEISTKKMMIILEQLENKHSHLEMVSTLKNCVSDTGSRAIFYETCSDVTNDIDSEGTTFSSCLNNIFDKREAVLKHRSAFLNKSHILLTTNLIEMVDKDEITLSRSGAELFLKEYASSFRKQEPVNNRYEFLEAINKITNDLSDKEDDAKFFTFIKLANLEKQNSHFSFVTNLVNLIKDFDARFLFYVIAREFTNNDQFYLWEMKNYFSRTRAMEIIREIKSEKMVLQTLGLAEIDKNAMISQSELKLTEKGKELFFEEDYDLFTETVSSKDLITPSNIVAKQLFFEQDLQRQLTTFSDSLQETNYRLMVARLQEKNLPIGVAALFYGSPGTGKTESVLQIAKKTGRNIVHVDISSTKSCWFGESEKLIKEVFERYKRACQKSKVKPILLFNEADAVFSKRKDINSGNVAQTENAIQNIILEEMEKLDGILVATTNLIDNLDKAFERRFLFKIHFQQPTIEAKTSIWLNKIPSLHQHDAERLASQFDFSGGEIDNIVRKATMNEIVAGTQPDYASLLTLCQEEKIGKQQGKIGFK